MDDIGSVVTSEVHDVGRWRGPSEGPWVLRIAHGAGFGTEWERVARAEEPLPLPHVASHRLGVPNGLIVVSRRGAPSPPSLRMWWLPSARDR